MGHPIFQLAKNPRGSRAVRSLRDYKLSSLGASRLASPHEELERKQQHQQQQQRQQQPQQIKCITNSHISISFNYSFGIETIRTFICSRTVVCTRLQTKNAQTYLSNRKRFPCFHSLI